MGSMRQDDRQREPFNAADDLQTTQPVRRRRRRSRRISNGLVALSSAAVLSIYAAGFVHTQAAADAVDGQDTVGKVAQPPPAKPTVAAARPAPVPSVARRVDPEREGGFARRPGNATAPTVALNPTPAPAAAPAPVAAAPAGEAAYRDGTYVGLGTSRHGNIEATVVIQGGKIVSAQITQCLTRYPCSVISGLPAQVVARQGTAVDLVSRATDSSVAYRSAVAKALAQAT